MDEWLLIHSDSEFVDVDDDASSISSGWSVMNFQDVEMPECSLLAEGPQPSSSSAATTPTDANLPPPPAPILPQVLPNHRRHGRRRARATATRHNVAVATPAANRATSAAVRQALGPIEAEPMPIAFVNAKMANQANLFAHMQLERRYLRRGRDCNARAQQDRKHAKWLNGQARIGHAHQRAKAHEI